MSDEMQSVSELLALIERAIAQTNDSLALVREARELLGLGEGPLDIGPTDLPPPREGGGGMSTG